MERLALRLEVVVEDTEMVVFEISDNGKGMTPEFLETIFNEYSQQAGNSSSNILMQKSTGLGMAILAKYVEMGGGTVNVESQLGQGSFTMTMPREFEDDSQDRKDLDELSQTIRTLS